MTERPRNPEQPRFTDEELVEMAIARAVEAKQPIDDATARVIASMIHSGQTSAMYSLSSTGYLAPRHLELEMRVEQRFAEHNDAPEISRWIDQLRTYVEGRESHEAVEGWSSLWLEQPEPQENWLDRDDRCTGCGAHFSGPCEPGCRRDAGEQL